MQDRERFSAILSDLERFFTDLEEMGLEEIGDLEDKKTFYSVSMILFSILNRAIDLGEEIVSAKSLGTPGTYKEIFYLLWKGKMINKTMKDELSELSSYRNLFSHDYHGFTIEDVFDAYQRIGAVKKLMKRVKEILK